ncbi:3-oxoacyl-ACP synthase III family protein [Kitasatospora sp. NPDC101176]|uniref:3-oxoacyl-ACP synthase III family protein n=1 Tax=Kitasatospora sp. NPDC101176 TaxID=3364099 RepID=UPI00381E967D
MSTSQMAAHAVEDLFANSTDGRMNIGLTILATSTPDQPQPATAVRMRGTPAFDVNVGCSGFLHAVDAARCMIRKQLDSTALVIGTDLHSPAVNRTDRRIAPLFGDAAGAVLLANVTEGYGIHTIKLQADADGDELAGARVGGTREAADGRHRGKGRHLFRPQGRAVEEYARTAVPQAVDDVLREVAWSAGDIDRAFLHQGSTRMIEILATESGINMNRIPLSAPPFGSTGAASIPFTLAEENRRRPIEQGERIPLASVGGGTTTTAAVLTWF